MKWAQQEIHKNNQESQGAVANHQKIITLGSGWEPYIFSKLSTSGGACKGKVPRDLFDLDEALPTNLFSTSIGFPTDLWRFFLGTHIGQPEDEPPNEDSLSWGSQLTCIAWPQAKTWILELWLLFITGPLHTQHVRLRGAYPWEAPFFSKLMV